MAAEPEQIETLVVGAGPAGLGVARELGRRGLSYVVIEKESAVAPSWRGHYDRLHLHTAKGFSELPGMAYPREVSRFPSRDEVVAYMEAYARKFRIEPRFGVAVEWIEPDGDRWSVRTSAGEIRARQVVIAAGRNRDPYCPTWPGMETFPGEVLHTSVYRNGEPWKGRRVLVVGSGNSGAEIALDLTEHGATADLCVRGYLLVTPRDNLGLPPPLPTIVLTKLPIRLADAIARSILDRSIGDLSRWGIRPPPFGPIRSIVEHGRVPLIDVGTLDRIKRGEIRVRPAIERFEGSTLHFVDGECQHYDAVILGTGYRAGLERILEGARELVDDKGRAERCGEAVRPGLYLVGYSNPPTGFLREIAREARRAARNISKNQ